MPDKKKKQLKAAPKRRKAKRAKSKPSGSATKSQKTKTVVAAVLDSQKLQSLYATMLKTRLLSQRAGEILSAQQKDNTTAGREAVLVGAIAHALPGDSTVAAQNSLLTSFIRGTPLKSVFEQIIPAGQQSSNGSTADMSRIDSSSGSILARGMALANEIKGTPSVILVFTREFSADRDAPYEELALAAQSKLPLVCLAETANIEEHAINLPTKGAAHFPRIAVDGSDVVAVFRVAQEAVRRARAGHGPSLIECVIPEHTHGHETATTVVEESCDPLAFMQQYLQRRKLWSDEWKQKITDEFREELDTAIANAENLPAGKSSSDRTFAPNPHASRPPRSLPQSDKTTPSRA
ncbi:MAG TPA: thiamine pyrophosphate-dependent enzyme [Candidatus Angelobacter sp.]|nr:thiamine pyrophosphate-dependent enzyme [Candidatus Angelobacter sp.]